MKSRISSLGLPAALLSASLFGACQNTARGIEQDTQRNTAEAKQEAREANAEARQEAREANAELKQEAREAGNTAERAGDRVANETKDATHSVGATLDAAAQTMQIKTAFIDADNLDAEQHRCRHRWCDQDCHVEGPCADGGSKGRGCEDC